jgi:hypothetical protein
VRIERGTHWLCPLIARLAGFPKSSPGVAIELTVAECGKGRTWRRQMGATTLITVQTERRGLLAERYGLIETCFDLAQEANMLVYRQVAAAIVLGPIRIPLPRWLAPRVAARTQAVGDSVHFRVEVAAPVAGTVLIYEGSVQPEAAA